MLWSIVLILLVLWAIGFATSTTIGGLRFIQGRRAV
jgi:Family of unknown function (DUF5670)